MSNNTKTRLIKPMRTRDDLGKWDVKNTTATKLPRGSVLRINGTVSSGAYHTVELAIADGTQPRSQLLVVWADHDAGTVSIASERRLVTMDTSTAAIGDLVYLSDTVAGAMTFTVSSEPIGRVNTVGTAGYVWIDAKWTLASATAGDLEGYRPDVDLDWEALRLADDGKVHVDGASGNDVTGDGTVAKPFLSVMAAILTIPHNRTAPALRNTSIVLDTNGIAYLLPTHLEALSQITIAAAALPAINSTHTVNAVGGTATPVSINLTTTTPYTSDDVFKGFYARFASGKAGWVVTSVNNGGDTRFVISQAVNGSAYDNILVSDAFDLYDPADFAGLWSSNTGGNGTNFDQSDGLKFSKVRLDSIGGSGKFVFYQSRVTLADCHVGAGVGRIYANNGNLTITNCFINPEGENQEFGMVGAGPYSLVQLRGGTVFDGDNGAGGSNWPVTATGNSRVVTAGAIHFHTCKPVSLANGAAVDYANGYNADVNWYITNPQAGVNSQGAVEVTLRDGGAAVQGTIPDVHGDTLDVGSILVYAKAPARLWVGRGTTIPITGKSGYVFTLTDGSDWSSGNAYDDSFIRMDRARAYSANPGVGWGPHLEAPTGGSQAISIDWGKGPSQVYDLSDASNNAAIITWVFPDNGELGSWATLEIVQATAVTYNWDTTFKWAGGSAPTLSAVSGNRDFLRFFYTGVEWVGEAVALDVS